MVYQAINMIFLVANYFVIFIYYALIAWVILSWVTLIFNKHFAFNNILNDIINPLLKPFKWARIGMIDLSLIVLIYAISFLLKYI